MRLPALVIVALAAAGTVAAAADPQPAGAALEVELAHYLTALSESHAFSGAVRVERRGELVLRVANGWAEAEHQVPLTPTTRFRIGSLTKPFTAAAALVLVQEGRLRLQDPICRYVAHCPAAWSPVTIRHLLSHSSGIPDLFGDVDAAPLLATRAAIDAAVAAKGQGPLLSAPGTTYAYSNFNYMLVGYAMEVATGSDWQSVLRHAVLEPLGLHDTFYDDVWAVIPRRSHPYRRQAGELRNVEYDDHAAYAAGGLLSTVDDLALFLRGLAGGRVVREPLLAEMFTPVAGSYGYGMALAERFGRPARDHYGGTDGFTSYFLELPREELRVVVLSNVENESARGVGCDLAAIALGAPGSLLSQAATYRPSDEALERLTGVYGDEVPRIVERAADGLHYRRGDSDRRLLPLAPDEMALEGDADVRLHFELPAAGRATTLRATQCGTELFRGSRRQEAAAPATP